LWNLADQGQPELSRESEQDGIGKISAQHIHGGVGKIQDVHHPEYQRQPRRNQKQQPVVRQSMKKKTGMSLMSVPLAGC
jgi:hypothetical protein